MAAFLLVPARFVVVVVVVGCCDFCSFPASRVWIFRYGLDFVSVFLQTSDRSGLWGLGARGGGCSDISCFGRRFAYVFGRT
jgi:hypothetical protein